LGVNTQGGKGRTKPKRHRQKSAYHLKIIQRGRNWAGKEWEIVTKNEKNAGLERGKKTLWGGGGGGWEHGVKRKHPNRKVRKRGRPGKKMFKRGQRVTATL